MISSAKLNPKHDLICDIGDIYQNHQRDLSCNNNVEDYDASISDSHLLVLLESIIVDFSKLNCKF